MVLQTCYQKKVWPQTVDLLARMYPQSTKSDLCGLFGFTRQAWYDSKKRQSEQQMKEVFILTEAYELRKEHKRMGAEKLLLLMRSQLEEHNIKCGRIR